MGKKPDGTTYHLRHNVNQHHTMCWGKVTETGTTLDIFKKKKISGPYLPET